MSDYAWIGLGNMGGPMSANLVAAGHTVKGFDLNEQACEVAAQGGVQIVGSIADAMDSADAVFTMLPKGQHVRSVYEGESGIWAHATEQMLLIDSSTVDIETSRYIHEGSAQRGLNFVDAPVSGGISGAAAGTLTFMLGGEATLMERATGYITPMSGRTIVAGAASMGIAAKICNNMMLFIDLMASAEGSQLAEKLGLDPQVFWEIASVSSGRSWAQQTWYPVPDIIDTAAANNNFEATFRTDLARKDIGLALDAGESTGVRLPAATLAKDHFDELIGQGLGDRDCSLIVKNLLPDEKVRGWNPQQAG
ncbi:3-hydroxyisobutyrate dehydrogenase [Arthrobacter sp. NIO-1057]|uniref:3-hydroxyisobutyrate dehydrogenase n=1 Tax=Arthrobacter sp. NIO-1057 TaxID=993071 RepID=UPI00071D169D|nr:3-hydroxyisobutyrate dehydrogenase [Arthrobacter sp. NIO-1057]KSU64193.1 3-hydroxyisobutyrate dehydrogenase [Arthrobacter sp. NIO-1057]SCC52040.1 3-hydroxyisobutyrate dehydrogenase [Arthrobacter sp. NIO-1057]